MHLRQGRRQLDHTKRRLTMEAMSRADLSLCRPSLAKTVRAMRESLSLFRGSNSASRPLA